ncbi:WD repeat-containing protein 92 [Apostichopus japonicus]|uniref:Dynein axonemal assembly factor 10 n=2 Tax=Stichopus japonicus TaxID=307972 RepID=A0A2G8KAV0_STIJA|nr:WD repeat-containing protein 92 [Apostichopus japonicus]
MNKTLFDVKWVPCSARFVVLGNYPRQTGSLQVCEMTSSGEINVVSEVEKKDPFKCGTFGASSLKQRNFATGDFAGNLRIWDLEKTALPLYSTTAHTEIINSIDGVGGLGVGEGPRELVTGSRDGSVKVWDPRQKDDPVACMKPKEGETKRDCWSVAFGHAHNQMDRCVAAGYDNGDIKLFDLKNMSLRWDTNVKNGVCFVEFDRKDINMNKLVATVLESKIHVFDMRTQHPKKGFAKMTEKAHDSTVWAAKHLPQNRDIFMTLGGNGSAYLWKYQYPANRVAKDSDEIEMGVAGTLNLLENTTLSKQPINALDWSPDKEGLAVCTAFDQCVRVLIVTKLARV